MRSTSIQHPAHQRMLVIREWQLTFCDGDHCAAALLGFFEYWHNIRLEMREKSSQANATANKHGEEGTQDASLFQFHTEEQLKDGLLGMYGDKKIREAKKLLVEKGAISVHRNPNPRYAFDSTAHFLFNPDVCQQYINHTNDGDENAAPVRQNRHHDAAKVTPRRGENAGTSPEITPEITSEREKKTLSSKPSVSDARVLELIEAWNHIPGTEGLPKITERGSRNLTLQKKIRLRLQEHPDDEFWTRVLNSCWKSPFLRGEKGGWKVTLHWLVENDINALKVYEGHYNAVR